MPKFLNLLVIMVLLASECAAISAFAGQDKAHPSWVYGTQHDVMRKEDIPYARIASLTEVPINNGKEKVQAFLTIGNLGSEMTAIFSITHGELKCPMLTGCEVSLRLDDNPVQVFHADKFSASDTTELSLGAHDRLAHAILNSHYMIVEIDIQRNGPQQFAIDLSNLDSSRLGQIPVEVTGDVLKQRWLAQMREKTPGFDPDPHVSNLRMASPPADVP